MVKGTIVRKENGDFTFSGTFKTADTFKTAAELTNAHKEALKTDFKGERDALISDYPELALVPTPDTGEALAGCDNDADVDSLTNAGDGCPTEPGPPENNGCPNGGGIAEPIALGSDSPASSSGSARDYTVPAAAAAGLAGVLAIAAGGWYVRRRRLR